MFSPSAVQIPPEVNNTNSSSSDLGSLSGTISINRVVNFWYSLPSDVVSTPSVAVFKKRLVEFWAQSAVGYGQGRI